MPLNIPWSHKIDLQSLIAPRLTLDRSPDANDTFAHATDSGGLNVVIEA